ncbi:MAG: hypothetical protein AABY22_33810 [Nanoarchaeota archaeon]
MVCSKCNCEGTKHFIKGYCKKCYDFTWRLKNKDRFIESIKVWQSKHQDRIRKYRQKNKKKFREYYRTWYAKNGRNRAIDYQEATIEWSQRHPNAKQAHQKVQYALKIGEIIKSKNCSYCSRETRLVAHHRDYLKPLEVLWLCYSCHKEIHFNS